MQIGKESTHGNCDWAYFNVNVDESQSIWPPAQAREGQDKGSRTVSMKKEGLEHPPDSPPTPETTADLVTCLDFLSQS